MPKSKHHTCDMTRKLLLRALLCTLQVLRCLSPVKLEDTVLGQYTAAGDQRGYLEDETVPKGSKTPTFATCVMNINNERCDYTRIVLVARLNCLLNALKRGYS